MRIYPQHFFQSQQVLATMLFALATLTLSENLRAQGCVASRGGACPIPPTYNLRTEEALTTSGPAMSPHGDKNAVQQVTTEPDYSGFSAYIGYRYLKSDRHFVGDSEQRQRQREGSEVINKSNFFDVGISYAFNQRFSMEVVIPFSVHDRSQALRNAQRVIIERFHTQAAGLGDIRLLGHMWLLDPLKHPTGNIQVGLGVDCPTGEKDARDTFRVFDAATGKVLAEERTVDQSIQPGDGGWGILFDFYAYQRLFERCNLYMDGTYALTPEETNDVPTFRSNPFEAEMSVADTYSARLGVEYVLSQKYGLTVGIGGRVEGVTKEDLIGGSDGFRRPGLAVSIEPSIGLALKNWSAFLSVPIAVYRNRFRSVADEQQSAATGEFREGDAAFADYLVQLTVGTRF